MLFGELGHLDALHRDAHGAGGAGQGPDGGVHRAAFMSFILVLAISSSWARVILPTLSLCGVAEPFSSLIAFLIRAVAGGVLMMKVKLLSAKR